MAPTSSFIILGILLVVMLVIPMFSNKKRNQEYQNMLDNIHVGDTVETSSGIIGKVVKFIDKGEICTMIIETGSKTEKCYLEIDKLTIYKKLNVSKVANSKNEVEKSEENQAQAENATENLENYNADTPKDNNENKATSEIKKDNKPRISTKKNKK